MKYLHQEISQVLTPPPFPIFSVHAYDVSDKLTDKLIHMLVVLQLYTCFSRFKKNNRTTLTAKKSCKDSAETAACPLDWYRQDHLQAAH